MPILQHHVAMLGMMDICNQERIELVIGNGGDEPGHVAFGGITSLQKLDC